MIFYILFILILSYGMANLEIQIEGGEGWAKNLPTWRIEKHWLLDVFFGGRAMTGYHFWMLSFVFVLFHIGILFAAEWSWLLEVRVIGGYILMWAAEDFMWFVFNPKFGIRKFKKEHIPWHPNWIAGLPVEYWVFAPLCLLLIRYSYLGWTGMLSF